MYNYIPHPSNCSKSSMITTLLIEEGHAAYGIYWMVLELLRDCPKYRIGDSPKSIAWSIHCTDIDLVSRVLHNYGLFDVDGDGLLHSPWLLEQMASYDDKKRRLQEAGRRGAAKRFAKGGDREAIATLPTEDREAIAILHNVTQHDVTLHDVTESSGRDGLDVMAVIKNPGQEVSAELLEALCSTAPDGHAPGYLAQVCIRYKMGERVLEAMQELTNNADLTNLRYKALCAKIRDMEAKKWRPNMPANFFLKFLTNDN